MLELRHLHTIIALSEAGSLAAAARRVHLTQSALSHQLKLLEEHYRTRLFERKSVPLRLSPPGKRLLALAQEVEVRIQEGEREMARLIQGEVGNLRIAVECHSCFDWLMPAMDTFREHWAEVELDLVSGFHGEPVDLLNDSRADLAIVSRKDRRPGVVYHPLFGFEMLALLSRKHRLCARPFLTARDFARETLVTYPIPDERLDLVREVLRPAGVRPRRRTTELTVAILQLVASHRAVAALPGWAVQPYLDRGYVIAKRIGKRGLWSQLYAATRSDLAEVAYMKDFIQTMRAISFSTLQGIETLQA
jgi:LysR family transcriptional regulator for metE and metH